MMRKMNTEMMNKNPGKKRPFSLFILFYALLFIMSAGCPFSLFASDLDDARLAETDGNISRAIDLYTKWLSTNSNHPAFVSTLYKTALLINDLEKGIDFLEKYGSKIRNVTEKKEYLVRLAGLQEITGDLAGASKNYLLAASINGKATDYHFLLKHYRILWSMGESPSLEKVDWARRKTEDYSLYQGFTVLEAEILYSRGEYSRGVELLDELNGRDGYFENPLKLYMTVLGASQFNPELSKSTESLLLKKFPDSVEALLLQGRASLIYSPETFSAP